MPHIKAKRLLSGGLNVDLAVSVKQPETYRNGRNLRPYTIAEDQVVALKKVLGNRKVNAPLVFTDDALVVGGVEDADNDRFFYFVMEPNYLTNHCILCYSHSDDKVRLVISNGAFQDRSLVFSSFREYMVTGLAISGPMLYWTDNLDHPKRINVERGMSTFDSSYVPLTENDPVPYDIGRMKKEDITLIRRPPRYPLLLTKKLSTADADIPDQVNNFIGENSFQFTYRYQYRDGEYSVPAIFSLMETQNNEDIGDLFDTIEVNVSKREVIPYEVERIEFLARNGNTGSFYIVETFDRARDTQAFIDHNIPWSSAMGFYFFNSLRGVALADEKAYKVFDKVPLVAQGLEAARNRIVLGNYIMDLAPADKEVEINFEVSEEIGGSTGVNGEYQWVRGVCLIDDPLETSDYEIENERAYVLVRIETGDPAIDGFYVTTLDESLFYLGNLPPGITLNPDQFIGTLASLDVEENLVAWIKSKLGNCGLGTFYHQIDRNYIGTDVRVYGLGSSGSGVALDGTTQLKSDSRYGGGVLYFDWAGRTNGVVVGKADPTATPDRTYVQADYPGALAWTITDEDPDTIPIWADSFSVVRTRNLTASFFIQSLCQEVKYVQYDDNGVYEYVDTWDKDKTVGVAWDMSRLFSDKLGYTYQPGDLFKAYASDNVQKLRLPVISQIGKYVITKPQDIGDLTDNGDWGNSIVELYTPYISSDEEEFYYEVGNRNPINSPGTAGRTHSVLSGTFRGDVFIKSRDLGDGLIGCEAMNPNDRFFSEWNTDLGRAFLPGEFRTPQRREVNFTWSETWIPGTVTNGMSSFNALDEDSVDRNIGAIQKMVLAGRGDRDGTVMLAICESGTVSMYLGETQIYDNAGDAILATSGSFIGTKNILRGNYGTDHPESVVEENKNIYWFDVRKGVVVRYSSNDLFTVSSYGVASYFKELANWIGVRSQYRVVGGWYDREGEYWLGIPTIPGWIQDSLTDQYDTILPETRFSNGDTVYNLEAGKRYRITMRSVYPGNYLIDYTTPLYLIDYTSPDANYLADVDVSSGTVDLEYNSSVVLTLPDIQTGPTATFLDATVSGALTVSAAGGRPALVTIEEAGQLSEHSLFDGRPKMMIFSADMEKWIPPMEMEPEFLGRVLNVALAFKEGHVWVHDDEAGLNSLFGTVVDSVLVMYVNEQFSTPKLFMTLAVEGTNAPDWTHLRIVSPWTQSSDLVLDDWEQKEGVWYAAVLRDRLDPNYGTDEIDRLYNGADMRGQYASLFMRWEGQTDITIFLIDVGMNVSTGHTPLVASE